MKHTPLHSRIHPKHGKAILWVLGVGAFGAGAYLVYAQLKAKKLKAIGSADDVTGKSGIAHVPVKVPASHTSATDSNSGYPIKKGSTGALVKQLQDLLGITMDGVFGSKTQAALQEQAGITQVDSASQMSEINDAILARDQQQSIADRAAQLYNTYQDGNSQLMAANDAVGVAYTTDKYGAITYQPSKTFTLKAGYKFNRDQFTIDDYSKSGKILVQINTPDTVGGYAFDASQVTLG